MENSKSKVQSRKFRVGSLEVEVFLVLALFMLALLPRVLNLNTFITWDEPAWTYRSIKFLTALRRMDFGGTFLVGHPGVLTMWSGAVGISIQRLLGFPPFPPTLGGQGGDFAWLSGLPTLDPKDVEALRKLAPFLSAAKLPMAVLNAACVVGVYLLARRLFDAKAALLATLLLAVDPFHLALSRVLHIDALAANFMILSVLSLLVHLRQPRSRLPLLLSGAFAALAVLSKSYALFLAPFSGLLLATAYLVKERDFRQAILLLLRFFATWCLAAAFIFFILWPAMWVDPLGTVQGMLGIAFGFAVTPGRTSEFFLGKAVTDPGLWFYPVALAFRTMPLTVLGLAAANPLLFSGLKREDVKRANVKCETKKVQGGNLVAILAYACLFIILMNLGAKKFDRYMLPVIMALDIVAAWGLVELGKLVNQRLPVWSLKFEVLSLKFGFWILLFLFQTGHIFSYHPYYLAYYNPLVGGTPRAVQVLPIGWGEGMDLAARYLNQKEDVADLRVATAGMPGFAPLFKGQTEGLTEHNLATADYAVLYVSDVQQASTGSAEPNSPDTAPLYGQQQPEHVVNIHGVDYAWIYRNTHYQELIAYLESQAQPDDIVLLDANSPFDKYYQGPLPYHVIPDSQSWTQMVNRLTESAGPQHLWYIAYPESYMGSGISYQLSTHALLIDQETLPYATISCYLLTSPRALGASPIEVQSNVNFGARLRLISYSFAEDVVEYRKRLGITLHWQAQQGMEESYALSLRLVDGEEHLWAQLDEWLLNQSGLPTSAWETSEMSEGHYLLPIPAGIPPGRYQVRVTVYRTDTLEGVAILDEEGKPAGTEYTLGMISITSPTVPPTTEELAIPYVSSYDFSGQVGLLGYGLSADEVRSGDTLGLTLFWQALRPMERDYRLHLQVRDVAGHVWAEGEFPLANEGYPTSRWNEGETICGQYDLIVDAATPTGEFSLLANLLDEANGSLVEREGVNLTRLSVVAPQRLFTVPDEIQHPLRVNLADKVAFLGYDLDKATVRPGDTLHLTLYWQTLAEIETSYTVFVHLLDTEYRIWGQKDSVPVKGTHPTTSWLPGEVVIDEYEVVVDTAAPAGEYQIEVGMYDLETMLRLPTFDEAGKPLHDDRLLLEPMIIVGSEKKWP